VIVSVLVFGSLFGVIGAIIGVPTAAAVQIVAEELTADRRARVAGADAGASGEPQRRGLGDLFCCSSPAVFFSWGDWI
jgi:hypothetical protein